MHQCSSVWSILFNDTATTEIYTLALHDALPIWPRRAVGGAATRQAAATPRLVRGDRAGLPLARPAVGHAVRRRGTADRKSTRLNSSHANISYAVFCLKKKNMSSSTCIFSCVLLN